jgi:hypothetical protein
VPPSGGLGATAFLALATPVAALGKTAVVPKAWNDPPAGKIDPTEKSTVLGGPAQLDDDEVAVHTAAYATDMSRQVIDWSPLAQLELTALFASIVDTALETQLLSDLSAAATAVPAGADLPGTLDTAAGSSSWPAPVDVWVSAIGDVARIRRAYTAQSGAPLIVFSAAQPPGTVLGFPRAAVAFYATALAWMTSDRPSVLGVDVGAYRYGFATARKSGAVVSVTLPGGAAP